MSVHTATLNLEVYVKGRETPLMWPLRIDVDESITTVGEIMIYANGVIKDILCDIREPYLELVDERASHHLVLRDQLQAISVQAPDQSFITWGSEDV